MKAVMKNILFLVVCLIFLRGIPALGQDNPPEINEVFDKAQRLILEWNEAINTPSATMMRELYAENATVYGASRTRDEVVAGKLSWLKKHPGYRQEVDLEKADCWLAGSDNTDFVWASFPKTTYENGKSQTFTAVLQFVNGDEGFQIIEETDLTTEHNLHSRTMGKELANGEYCFSDTRWYDVRNSGLGHTGPIRRTTDLSFSLENGRITDGGMGYYSGFTRMYSEFQFVSGKYLGDGKYKITLQYLDITSLEPSGPPQTLYFVYTEKNGFIIQQDSGDWFTGSVLWECPE